MRMHVPRACQVACHVFASVLLLKVYEGAFELRMLDSEARRLITKVIMSAIYLDLKYSSCTYTNNISSVHHVHVYMYACTK